MMQLFESAIENESDVWLTDPRLIKSLGPFDLDPCSPLNRPWDTAKKHYTVVDDGLLQPWTGRVWCNPPYSKKAPWVKRCSNHGDAVLLIFSTTDTIDFHRYIFQKADSIFFIAGRLTFYDRSGKPRHRAPKPSCLVAYGENNSIALANSGLQGEHLPVKYTPMLIVGISPTWVSVVSIAVERAGKDAPQAVYEIVERMAPGKIINNQHWKAKVRQCLQVIRKQQNN